METQIFFNSFYYGFKFENRTAAAKSFCCMVEGLKTAINYGAKDELVSSSDAMATEIAPNYTIRDWVNDRSDVGPEDGSKIDRELQRYFVRRLDKSPYFEDEKFLKSDDYLGCEVELICEDAQLKSNTATLTFVNSGIVLSPPLSVFTESYLVCNVSEVETEEVYQDSICCIYNSDSASTHSEKIQVDGGLAVTQSKELWEFKEKLFPELEFCSRVEQQLQNIDCFRVIYTRLKELESYCKNWEEGAFDPALIPSKVSGESEQVRSNRKAVESRTFQCPDGESRIFLWHMRATPGAIRIHFYPIEQNRKIIIGHIGEKLYYV